MFTLAAGMLAFYSCGPSAEEKAAAEQARLDSIASVEKAMMDSIAAVEMAAMQQAILDSTNNANAMKATEDSLALIMAAKTSTKKVVKTVKKPVTEVEKKDEKVKNKFDKIK